MTQTNTSTLWTPENREKGLITTFFSWNPSKETLCFDSEYITNELCEIKPQSSVPFHKGAIDSMYTKTYFKFFELRDSVLLYELTKELSSSCFRCTEMITRLENAQDLEFIPSLPRRFVVSCKFETERYRLEPRIDSQLHRSLGSVLLLEKK